jgi:Protein of unknown function (DUF2585)
MSRASIFLVVFICIAHVGTLYLFGQAWVCGCGVQLWEGSVTSAGNSQQVADWYTFSHIIHGFIFYWFGTCVLAKIFPKTFSSRGSFVLLQCAFVCALLLEVACEVAENTPAVIQHYRQQALAAGYVGDSILNSTSDVLAMSLGFVFASRVSVRTVVGLALTFEIVTAYTIRDNLTLNVINLAYPFAAIHAWQEGTASTMH